MAESKRIKGLMDENEKLKAKIEILTQENRKFVCEIMFLLYLMKQKDHQDKRSMKAVITITDDATAEDIEQEFHEYFNDIELLPRKLKKKNTELWPVCCKIFQTSFLCCRDEFFSRLVWPLYSLSEKTKDENKETGSIDFERQKKLEDIISAFKILLKQVDSSVVERVKSLVLPESETSFQCCQDDFLSRLVEPLNSLTEMTKYENETGFIDFGRQKKLEDITSAFKILQDYSLPKLKQVDSSVVERVKSLVFPESSHDTGLSTEKQDELIRNAVEICWKMFMLPRPMFVCQPEAFSDNLHERHRKSWNDGPGELVYYRPVLMSCAGGTRAIKGLVGKKPSTGKANNNAGQSPTLPANKGDIPEADLTLQLQCKLCGTAIVKDTDIYCHNCFIQLMRKSYCLKCHKFISIESKLSGPDGTAPHFCIKCPFCSERKIMSHIDTGKFVVCKETYLT